MRAVEWWEPEAQSTYIANVPEFMPATYDPTIAGWEMQLGPCPCGCGRYVAAFTALPAPGYGSDETND